jgi:hypothetical protein
MLGFHDLPDSEPAAVPTAFDSSDLACNKQFGLKRQFFGAQDPEFDQELPDGISFKVEPGDVYGINTHYTNPYNVPIFPEVWVNFWGSTTPTPKELKSIFPGDFTFSIPPFTAGEGNLVVYTHSGSPGCFFGLSSHSHRRNTGFKIWTSQPSNWDDPDDLIYDNPDWDHPTNLILEPRMLLDPGDKLWFQCQWDNGFTNPADVTARCRPFASPSCEFLNPFVCFSNADCGAGTTGVCEPCPTDFGPLSEDEMCFLPGTYYDADAGGVCNY